ncbi:hypothetical protein Q3A80_29860, partial [Burkholderia sp. SR8]|uniref:hypothetical protein n=1 Tax=Burkholderia sp. SR8 TaxID=3062277 RepID=UPI0040637995
ARTIRACPCHRARSRMSGMSTLPSHFTRIAGTLVRNFHRPFAACRTAHFPENHHANQRP